MTIAVLASGTGTILEAILEAGLPVSVVLVDRPCGAEKIGERAGIEVVRVVHGEFGKGFDREAYTSLVVQALEGRSLDAIAMAGYGTILSPAMVEAFPGIVLNTHPALLPAFKGWHAVADALTAGVAETGCTVHIVTAEVDEGPILAQRAVPVLEGDTVESLHERIKEIERKLYPDTVWEFLNDRRKA